MHRGRLTRGRRRDETAHTARRRSDEQRRRQHESTVTTCVLAEGRVSLCSRAVVVVGGRRDRTSRRLGQPTAAATSDDEDDDDERVCPGKGTHTRLSPLLPLSSAVCRVARRVCRCRWVEDAAAEVAPDRCPHPLLLPAARSPPLASPRLQLLRSDKPPPPVSTRPTREGRGMHGMHTLILACCVPLFPPPSRASSSQFRARALGGSLVLRSVGCSVQLLRPLSSQRRIDTAKPPHTRRAGDDTTTTSPTLLDLHPRSSLADSIVK